MTKVVASNKATRITCKNPSCKKRFTTTDSRKTFCSRECKESKALTTARKSTYSLPLTNHFFIYLSKEVERAGTLHILDHLVGNTEALTALYKVVRTRLVANVHANTKTPAFHVAHIAPTKHESILGFLSAENLIVLPAVLNRAHSNTHINKAGVFMYRTDMKLDRTILSTDKDLMERVIGYIGLDTVIEFAKAVKLTPSQRATVIAKLTKLVNPDDESHKQFIALLQDHSTPTAHLVAAIEAIECKKQFSPMMRGARLTPSAMMIEELIRHSEFRPELQEYATICAEYSKDGFHHNNLSADSMATLSRVLHGEFETQDVIDELKFDLRSPIRAIAGHVTRLALRKKEGDAQELARIQAAKAYAATWEGAELIASLESGFNVDYCLIPYMLTLNLNKPTPVFIDSTF